MAILWITGIGMILFLSFPDNKIKNSLLSFINKKKTTFPGSFSENQHKLSIDKSENIHQTDDSDKMPQLSIANSAGTYIFVTINKKHFLTRFTSFYNEEEVTQTGSLNNSEPEKPVTIIKKIKSRREQKQTSKPKSEDFSIKPVPQK